MRLCIPRSRPVLAALLAAGLALPGLAAALTLDETLALAERQAPILAAQAANRAAARQAAIPAGALPDPRLTLGLRNVPIEGDPAWQFDREAMTMQTIGLIQDMPNQAKRDARVDAAEAGVALADVQAELTRLRVRQATAEAWIAARAVDEKLALFKRLYDENRLFERAVQARLAGGRGAAADAIAPKQEVALLDEQQDRLVRDRAVARAALANWIGDAAVQPLTGDWPTWQAGAAHYHGQLDQHPELLAYTPRVRQAEARLDEAIADKRPDWAWGVEYGRREAFGDMVSLNLSFDLPVFTGSRQNPRIAAERARVLQLEAERDAARRQHDQQLARDLAERQRLDQALERLDRTLLPLAEDKVRLSLADYRGGRGALDAVVDARRALIETRLRRIDTLRDRALAAARLHFAFGETP